MEKQLELFERARVYNSDLLRVTLRTLRRVVQRNE